MVSSGIVLVPIISSPAEFKDTNVPLRLVPGAPGVSVKLPTSTAIGSAVIARPATVVTKCSGTSESRDIVLDPMMRADEPSDIEVPDTVIGGAFGVNVVPSIEIPLFVSG